MAYQSHGLDYENTITPSSEELFSVIRLSDETDAIMSSSLLLKEAGEVFGWSRECSGALVDRKRKVLWQSESASPAKIRGTEGGVKMDELMAGDEVGQQGDGDQKKNVDLSGSHNGAETAGSSSSSHLSPSWQVNELDLDLANELSANTYMNEALLSLPSLTVFKQEAPSPTGGSPPRRLSWQRSGRNEAANQVNESAVIEGSGDGGNVISSQGNMLPQQSGIGVQEQVQSSQQAAQTDPYNSPEQSNESISTLLACNSHPVYDNFIQSSIVASPKNVVTSTEFLQDDLRFQYVLAAATSIATKTNEETLTYLNQGQPYEVKLKKLGDLSHYKGKILKSIIKICFHERRLQYMEREQMALWHNERPGERIVEVDIPLSYGLMQVSQPSNPLQINTVEVLWDPTKDVGVYIKVNCISTEFTAKKHGGEKGVPFRVQVETFLPTRETHHRLHAAACQIKVFKLKGADRKHKQDREKVMRRPRIDLEKYQPSCECTVLTTLSNELATMPPSVLNTSGSYSPELCVPVKANTSLLVTDTKSVTAVTPAIPIAADNTKPAICQPGLQAASIVKLPVQESCPDVKTTTSPLHQSPIAPLPIIASSEDIDQCLGLSKEASSNETQSWLTCNRFSQHAATFTNFSGADLLRLSRDDLIQICGLADGIRLFNALHAKGLEARLTIYVSYGSDVYSAIYLHSWSAAHLCDKLRTLIPHPVESVLVAGPNGTRVRLTDDVVRHLRDNSTYRLQPDANATILMTPARHGTP